MTTSRFVYRLFMRDVLIAPLHAVSAVWLRWRGLNQAQIAPIYAAPVFVRANFTAMIAFLADRHVRPVTMLRGLAGPCCPR
jgi:hypothetical protein